ncbi:MAG TPA: hypothetical protein VNG34_07285, partial [Actinomycetota bacterium]|nr:hypothetical protein [Actinomycetota bacterium]
MNASWPPRSSFDVDGKRSQLDQLEQQASDPSLWDDPAHGQAITSKLSRLKTEVDGYDRLMARIDDAVAMDE